MIVPLMSIDDNARLEVWIIDYGCDRRYYVGDTSGRNNRYTNDFEDRTQAHRAWAQLLELQRMTQRLVR